jgi:hypothetical protein
MPVRFTCRLMAYRRPDGNTHVRYAPLDDEDGMPLVFEGGSEVLLAPTNSMTPEEFERWQFWACSSAGYSQTFDESPAGKALVEVRRTVEDEIPDGCVSADLEWEDGQSGEKVLTVKVTNGWFRPIPKLSLSVCHQGSQHYQIGSIPVEESGGSMRLQSQTFLPDNTIYPGYVARFALPSLFLDSLRSQAAVMSPDDHWLALETDGREFFRVGGAELATFLESDPQ